MRWIRFVSIACALVACSVAGAQAHAYVVGAQPPMNAGYADPAGSVAISFDEPIEVLDADAIEVFDGAGNRIDRHNAAVDPDDATRVRAGVPRQLDAGVYTVRWRVVSADTHVVHGSYTIAVGMPSQSPAVRDEPFFMFDASGFPASILRCIALLGALTACGAVFLCIAMLDRLERMFEGCAEAARRAAIGGSCAILVAAVPALLVQAASAGGYLGADVMPMLLHSWWGSALAVRAVAATALLLFALVRWNRFRIAQAACCGVLLACFSVTGHAIAEHSPAGRSVAVGCDFIHMAAAATWIGGLFVLVLILARERGKAGGKYGRELAWTLFAAFTPIATVSVCAIVVTGVYASVIHLAGPATLLTSVYGRLLLAKTMLVAVLLAYGYRHMTMGAVKGERYGGRTLAYEGAFGVAVVLVTAFLVGQMPPAHMIASNYMPH